MYKKIAIWGENIPYNNSRSKLADMKISGNPKFGMMQIIKFAMAIKGEKYRDKEEVIDTFTYCAEIKPGHEKTTYEDVPYLTAHLAPEGKRAVIIVPGGGYAYKSSHTEGEGKQGEGDLIAKRLNEEGISAFVLSYRGNPYEMPVPLLDLQRAIRFLRYHASEYGVDTDRIGAAGFSAGGFQVCGTINILGNSPVSAEGYTQDVIDKVSAKVNAAGLIYPCISFKYNVPMMFSAFPSDQIRDAQARENLLEEYDNINRVQAGAPPQFLCYGTKDSLVNTIQSKQYMEVLKQKSIPCTCLEVEGANHGFGAATGRNAKYAYWINEFIKWLKKNL